MTEYQKYSVNLSTEQIKKIKSAYDKGTNVTIRVSKENLRGDHKLPLTKTQINKIKKAKNGIQLNLSETQLKHMEKNGGFLPLLTLIPIIASALGAVGGISSGISSAVSAAKSNAEQARHNRAIEEQLKTGSGVVSDFVGKIHILGSVLGPLLKKIGLGVSDINKLKRCGCVCRGGLKVKTLGSGIFLEPEGSGIFFRPRTAIESFGDFIAKFKKIEPLSNFQIIDKCKELHSRHFKGVFMRDEL